MVADGYSGIDYFAVAVTIIRISNKRIFGKHSAFDIVLGIILGSILSRAITANSPFFPTIIAATVLVLLHRLLGLLAYKSDWLELLVKGHHEMLIKNGQIQWEQMSRLNISRDDIDEAMRKEGNTVNIESVKYEFLERSGDISIILKDDKCCS